MKYVGESIVVVKQGFRVQLLLVLPLWFLAQMEMVPLLEQTVTQPPLGAPLPLLLKLPMPEEDYLLASPANW